MDKIINKEVTISQGNQSTDIFAVIAIRCGMCTQVDIVVSTLLYDSL